MLGNILNNMVAKAPATASIPLSSSSSPWWGLGGGSDLSVDTADQQVSVFACCRILAESIGSLNLETYKKIDKNSEKAKDFSLYDVLNLMPNPLMTSSYYIEHMIYSLNFYGNSYSQIIRNGKGEVTAIYPLDSRKMKIAFNKSATAKLYEYDTGTRKQPFRDNEILHVAGLSDLNSYALGLSPIAKNMSTINAANAVDEFGKGFFERGATASGAFSTAGELGDDSYKRLKKDLADNYTGMINSSKPMLLESGLKFEKITIANNEAQFLETKGYGRTEISEIFRVPLHMLGDLSNATFSNIENLSIQFVTFSLLPWLSRIEKAMKIAFLTPEERKTYSIKFNVDALLRGDFESRTNGYQKLTNMGAMSINEVRALENQNPIDGGDVHHMQIQYAPLKQINNTKQL